VGSGTELFRYVDQIREIYEHAFTHIYLAVHDIRADVEGLVKTYLADLGYGLIKIRESVDVVVKAEPKKTYRSEHDYNEVTSRGLLYIAAKKALMEEGFDENHINVSPLWVGLKHPINYCAFLRGNYAAFGVYALGLQNVKYLIQFLKGRESLLQSLEERGFRVYLESYITVKGIRGYARHLEEPINADTTRTISNALNEIKKAPTPRWNFGLGVYRRLWNIDSPPTYATALKHIKDALAKNQLGLLRECIQTCLSK